MLVGLVAYIIIKRNLSGDLGKNTFAFEASLIMLPTSISTLIGSVITLFGSLFLIFDCPTPLSDSSPSYKLWVVGGLVMPALLVAVFVIGWLN